MSLTSHKHIATNVLGTLCDTVHEFEVPFLACDENEARGCRTPTRASSLVQLSSTPDVGESAFQAAMPVSQHAFSPSICFDEAAQGKKLRDV